jgi:hypothetical protein
MVNEPQIDGNERACLPQTGIKKDHELRTCLLQAGITQILYLFFGC